MTRIESATFTGSRGDELSARLDLPDGEPVAFALFAHCFTCSKDVVAATRISRGLVERGYGVLRFDFTGLGSSAGEFADTTFSSNVEDLVQAASMLRERHAAPTLLVGHSLGGAAVLAAAHAIPEATAVATIGAPFDPGHITQLFPPEKLAELTRCGEADIRLADRIFRVRRELIDDANAHNLTEALHGLDRALLVLHSARDEIVGIDNARRIFEAARHPKSFVSLDEADHLLSRAEDSAYVADVLAAWASRYLPTATNRRGWPLERVSVRLAHDRVHAEDCRDPIGTPCIVDQIDRTLELTGPLTGEQRDRLLAVAERCPVHRTLTGEIRVATRLRPVAPEAVDPLGRRRPGAGNQGRHKPTERVT